MCNGKVIFTIARFMKKGNEEAVDIVIEALPKKRSDAEFEKFANKKIDYLDALLQKKGRLTVKDLKGNTRVLNNKVITSIFIMTAAASYDTEKADTSDLLVMSVNKI